PNRTPGLSCCCDRPCAFGGDLATAAQRVVGERVSRIDHALVRRRCASLAPEGWRKHLPRRSVKGHDGRVTRECQPLSEGGGGDAGFVECQCGVPGGPIRTDMVQSHSTTEIARRSDIGGSTTTAWFITTGFPRSGNTWTETMISELPGVGGFEIGR